MHPSCQTLDGKEMFDADFRTTERLLRSVQSGPIGQCEYTNAARGGGWNHLHSYTNELRGNPDETNYSSRWHFVLAIRSRRHIANKSAECHLVSFHHCFLPELVRRARIATNATQTHAALAPASVAV